MAALRNSRTLPLHSCEPLVSLCYAEVGDDRCPLEVDPGSASLSLADFGLLREAAAVHRSVWVLLMM